MHTITNWRPIDLLTILFSNTEHIPIFMQTYYDKKKPSERAKPAADNDTICLYTDQHVWTINPQNEHTLNTTTTPTLDTPCGHNFPPVLTGVDCVSGLSTGAVGLNHLQNQCILLHCSWIIYQKTQNHKLPGSLNITINNMKSIHKVHTRSASSKVQLLYIFMII